MATDLDDVIVVEQDKIISVVAETTSPTVVVAAGGQGPAGAQGTPGVGLTLISKTSNEVVLIPRCAPVYADGAFGCKMAHGTDENKVLVLGLVVDSGGLQPATVGSIQAEYILTATTAEWDVVTGMVGGLSPGATYYLHNLLGKITPFYTDVQGFCCIVGKAVNSTDFLIRIEPPIKL